MLEPAQRLELGDLLEALVASASSTSRRGASRPGRNAPRRSIAPRRSQSSRVLVDCFWLREAISRAPSRASTLRSESMRERRSRSSAPHAACAGCDPAAREAARRRPRDPRGSAGASSSVSARRSGPTRLAPTSAGSVAARPRAATSPRRAPNRRARRRGAHEPRGRRRALRHRAHRRGSADACVPKARRALPWRARRSPARKRRSPRQQRLGISSFRASPPPETLESSTAIGRSNEALSRRDVPRAVARRQSAPHRTDGPARPRRSLRGRRRASVRPLDPCSGGRDLLLRLRRALEPGRGAGRSSAPGSTPCASSKRPRPERRSDEEEQALPGAARGRGARAAATGRGGGRAGEVASAPGPPGRGADLEHVRGQRRARVDAHEVPDGRDGLHGVRPGGRLRRRHEDRRQVRAVPRLRVHAGARRLGAGCGRGCGPHGPEQLPAGSAADGRRGIQRLSRHAQRRCRGRRRRRRRGGERPDRVPGRRRAQGRRPRPTDRSVRSSRASGSCSRRRRRPRRRGSRRCGRSCSTGRRSSGPTRRRRSRAVSTRRT